MNLLSELTPPVNNQSDSSSDIGIFLAIIIGALLIFCIIFLLTRHIVRRDEKAQEEQTGDGLDEEIEKAENLSSQQELYPESKVKSEKRSSGCLTAFIRAILILCIAGFTLVNYRLFSFKNGFPKGADDDMSFEEALTTLTTISKIEYYDTAPAPFTSNSYRIYIESSVDSYIFTATQDDIDALNALGLVSKIKPTKITPIPFYVEIILILVLLFVPFGGKKNTN